MGASEPAAAPDPHLHPIRPMQAAEGEAPAGSAWAFEFDWEGLRAIAYLRPGRVRLLSAGSERSITGGYPELGALSRLADQRGELVLDGRIVTLDDTHLPSRDRLRRRMSTPQPSPALLDLAPVTFMVNDVLHLDGRSTLELPYRRRRELLDDLDLTGLPAERSPYFLDADGRTVLEVAHRFGLGGVVAKRLDSRYQPGRRSRAWVRTAVRHCQRVVVGGWQPGGGRGGDPGGALLLGVPEADGLRYVGRVTAGLGPAEQRALAGPLENLDTPDSPFTDALPRQHTRGVRWVTPRLVGEVSYRHRESDGRLGRLSWVRLCPDEAGVPARPALSPGAPATPAPPTSAPRSSPEAPAPAPAPMAFPKETTAPDRAGLDEAVRLAQAEVRALRAQISPHFVYNALTTIAAFVRTDPPRARELLGEFAEYTRYSFRNAIPVSTLGAELANIERYLTVEQARFGERLRVVFTVEDGLRAVALPFLAVQPLVEVAVRHGIEGTPRGGTVRVGATAEGADCVVTVSEDVGVPADRLAEVAADVRARLQAAGRPGELTAEGLAEGSRMAVRVPR